MEEITNLKNQLLKRVEKYQEEFNEIEIMNTYITTTPELKQQWENTRNSEQSICGAQIPSGELTFQCFTCAPDPHHMFCYKCFIPKQHVNHISIIKHEIGGACDCGDEQTINDKGFCQNHKGFSKVNKYAELAKIPLQLQINVGNFIRALCHIYLPSIRKIRLQYSRFDVIALKIYDISEKHSVQSFKDIIDGVYEIEDYYKQFQQALRAHEILFRTISKLIEERFCFILLVTKIFQEKLQGDSHESIIEEIIENLVLLETQGPQASFKLEKICFSFFADYSFKEFMQQIFLKKYDCLWLKTSERSSDSTKQLKQFIKQIECFPKQFKLQINPDVIRKTNQFLEDYLKQNQQKKSQVTTLFSTSEILELHTQYVSEKLQNLFFTNPNIKNIFSQITKNLQTIQTERVCSFSQVLQFESVILRLDYIFFDKIAYKTLQNVLGQNYEIFLNQKVKKEILDAFPYKDFFLTALVESATNLSPIQLDLVEEDLTIWEEDLYDAIYYLMVQGLYVKTFQVGLSKIFSSEMCTQNLIENLNHVLILQCYNSLKNQRNKKVSVDAELQLALEKYFLNPQLTKENIFDRMSKIYLMLIKSDTYIDKIFIILLSNIYCLKQFKTSTEFKQYLSTLLNEDINELQRQFYFILTRCLQTYTSIQYCQNQYLENIYLGLSNQSDQITMLESYDTSFFRLYIFLFEENGFADFIQIIKNRFIPIPQQQLKLLCSLILRMIGSDLDVYNVCAKSIKILPNDLKLSLTKLVSNFSNLELYQEYPKIESQLQLLGIMISQNLPEHLLQVMEVDQSVKKLKLKPEYKPIYDPAIFHISSSVTQQIVEKFIQQEKPQVLIQLGNGIDYDVEQFSTNNYRQILKSMLQFYCKKPYIEKNLQFLNFQGQFLVQAYQLIYIQIVASNYFRKEELKNEASGYLKTLTDIKESTQRKDDTLRLTVLIEQIQQIVSKKIEVEQGQGNEKSKLFNMKKNQYKSKFQQLQQKEQLQKMMQQIEQENDKQEDEENCCSCRISLSTNQSSYLILLFEKPVTNILKIHPNVYTQYLNEQKVSLDYLGITTCQHSYHHKCLVERFECSAKNVKPELPDWVKLGCPVCKQACVFTMPIEKELSQLVVNEFNEQLVVYLMLKNSNYIDIYEKTPTQCLILIYFNLIFDLLTNLLSSTSDFKRDKKYNILNQLIRIFSETCKESSRENLIKFDFEQKDSIISIILNMIFENICINNNLQNVQIKIQQLLQDYNFNQEIKQQLSQSFCFENNQNIQLSNQQSENLVQQNMLKEIEFYSSLNAHITDQLKLQIGNNFQDFYYKYFTQCCDICGFYNKDQRNLRDFSLCLLCFKCFCHYSCQKKTLGNLNHHSALHHSGNSIFVSLRTGHVTLVSSPISISQYKCLFYNSLGQQVEVQHKQKNWDTYVIDLQKLKELAFIIQNNTYQTIVRNLEVRQNQLNLNGMI